MKYIWLILLWIKESFRGFFRNVTWNLGALLLTSFCLLVFGIAYIAGETADNLSKELGSKVEVQVNIKEEIDVNRHQKIREEIIELNNVKEIKYQSQEEIYEKMKKEMGKDADILEILNENPFTARFVVTLEDPNKLETTVSDIEALNIADNIQYGEGHVQRLLDIALIISKIGYTFTVIVGLTTMYVLSMIIKFNIDQRRNELRIKQLTGSGYFTIRIPFFIEALLITIFAVIIVGVTLVLGYEPVVNLVNQVIPYITFMDLQSTVKTVLMWLGVLSVVIAFVGTILATMKNVEKI